MPTQDPILSVQILTYIATCVLLDPPKTPFPAIEECKYEDAELSASGCSLMASSAINITCSVSGYFSSITLYFHRSSVKEEIVHSSDVTNADGTRNKSVTTTADPNEEPYVCVATDIPGYGDQEKETSIFIYAPSPSSTSTVITMSTEKNDESSSPQIVGQ